MLDNYLNTIEAGKYLGIHPETVKRLCRENIIPAEKIMRTWFIDKDKLVAFSKSYKYYKGI